MAQRVMKYNPAFLTEEELVQSFVVRQADLQLIVETIRENTGPANQHMLVVGPRGIGKTMLVLRVAAEVRRDEKLRRHWYPLVFSEESYEVTTPGEFWLEAIFHLGQQTKDSRWKQTYEELRGERDETRLRERALAQLMDFADAQGKRLLLVVENLNMLLGGQISHDDAWVLRHALQHERRVMLLASATTHFDEIENSGKAMFELFKTLRLEPLTEDECRSVWVFITGKEPQDRRMRPIQILTGGSPRLLSIISSFGASKSFERLMQDLVQLVDDHTEYFKTHLDNLPATERKVYLALAEIWDPATAREIAQAARLDTNTASSLLKRLVSRGAVAVADAKPRVKWYQVAERLYNIYYLMRRRGAPSSRVKAIVNFMISFYGEEELAEMTRHIAEEACGLGADSRVDHYMAYEAILRRVPAPTRRRLLDGIPPDFLEGPAAPDSLRELILAADSYLPVQPDNVPTADEGEREQFQESVTPAQIKAFRLVMGGHKLQKAGSKNEAEQAYRKAIELEPSDAFVWLILGSLLHQDSKRYDEAEQAYRKAIELEPGRGWTWWRLARLLLAHGDRFDELRDLAEGYLSSHPEDTGVRDALAWALYCARAEAHIEQAEVWAREAVENAPKDKALQHTYACVLCANGKAKEALAPTEAYFGDAELVERSVDDAIELAVALAAAGVTQEALDLLRRSPSVPLLEPLVVGLCLALGEDVKAAAEIVEVGKDVAQRIHERSETRGHRSESEAG